MNDYNGKWKRWLHKVSNGRWIVAENRGDFWFTKNLMSTGECEIKGQNQLDLVAKGARSYANVNAAIKALKRVYHLTDADTQRAEGDERGDR